MRNAIFIAFDSGFSLYARACLRSIEQNFPEHPEIFVLADRCDSQTEEVLQRTSRVHRVQPSDVSIPPEFSSRWSDSLSYRFHCFSDDFKDYDNVMYLDSDTLVLQPLYPVLKEENFFVVPNHEPLPEARVFKRDCLREPRLQQLLQEDGLSNVQDPDDMCNAGVFVVPRQYRNPETRQEFVNIAVRYHQFCAYDDQSIMSIWCKLNGIDFSPRYEFNFQAALFGTDLADMYNLSLIRILHFSSSLKPDSVEFMLWKRLPLSLRKELARMFVDYAEGALVT